MPIAVPVEDTDLLELVDWPLMCQHQSHTQLRRGHSDDSPVLLVDGLQLPCCGFRPAIQYLCQSWCAANPHLRCSRCGESGIPFEECYRIIGPV